MHLLKIRCTCSVRETELRQLRRQNTEYEEQNAILSKHVDNMKQAIEKLEVEATQQRSNNAALQQHLNLLRTTLVANFSRIPLPGTSDYVFVNLYNNLNFPPGFSNVNKCVRYMKTV